MSANRFQRENILKLQFDKKRFRVKICPCGRSNRDGKFVPYTGYENKGYCHSCGQVFLPEWQTMEWHKPYPGIPEIKYREILKTPSLIPNELLKSSLTGYEMNNFVKFLKSKFGNPQIDNLVRRYFIGTSKHWEGATVFWQIDATGKVRTGKIMLYNQETGKRVKEPYNHVYWVHRALNLADYNLKQCLYGEHLLVEESTKAVALVESEKTAIVASMFLPDFIWLATGSISNLNSDHCKVLQNRNVTLFPDANGFENWNKRANGLFSGGKMIISDLLERKASLEEKAGGFDLADYLLKVK